MIHSTAETDLLPLARFGVTDGDVAYFVVHSTKKSDAVPTRETKIASVTAWLGVAGAAAWCSPI